ncbi:hypothetical protein [Phytopseudomonas dryadis]|uniref:Transmembrane protein n=1 Tax=Phytopseudomonas dryadis TaxID=2487520 RepID=A0ABY1Z9C3_9GAMM|nr:MULTISPECIES: hypothetical protein [Pseudomonas]TBV07002.1 hypothetical protein DNK34_09250 [Pseudomonas dryadis]TBV19605.1 hypothetical protein DNK41_03465 [Pseudomonas sp. FRB 230]
MSHKRFLVHFSLAISAYIVMVVLSTLLLANQAEGPLRIAAALLPVLPMLAVAVVLIRQLRQLDELARQIQLEALGIAFVGTALITFSYGFLETAGFPRLSMFFVWSLMAPLWALGSFIGWRRYR